MIKKSKIRLLIIGQIPPPFHGQSVMVKVLYEGLQKSSDFNVDLLKMNMSKSIDEIGKSNRTKYFRLLVFVVRLFAKLLIPFDFVYFPLSGKNKSGIIRDMIVLFLVRKIFLKKVIYHTHAMGLVDGYHELSPWLRSLYLKIVGKPFLIFILSNRNADDVQFLRPKFVEILPNGIPDPTLEYLEEPHSDPKKPIILFCSNLIASKGVLFLLDCGQQLHKKGIDFEMIFVGDWQNETLKIAAQKHPFFSLASFKGSMIGKDKWRYFAMADIFCFPSFYENENFPLVLLEASAFGVPTVATNWRGIPDIVSDGETGSLFTIKNVDQCTQKLIELIDNKPLRKQWGQYARQKFINEFKDDKFIQNFRSGIKNCLK